MLFPLTAVGMAFLAQTKGWGLLNIVPAPAWLAIPAAVLLLDLTIYGQHVMFHFVPLLADASDASRGSGVRCDNGPALSSGRDCRLDTHQARSRSRHLALHRSLC